MVGITPIAEAKTGIIAYQVITLLLFVLIFERNNLRFPLAISKSRGTILPAQAHKLKLAQGTVCSVAADDMKAVHLIFMHQAAAVRVLM